MAWRTDFVTAKRAAVAALVIALGGVPFLWAGPAITRQAETQQTQTPAGATNATPEPVLHPFVPPSSLSASVSAPASSSSSTVSMPAPKKPKPKPAANTLASANASSSSSRAAITPVAGQPLPYASTVPTTAVKPPAAKPVVTAPVPPIAPPTDHGAATPISADDIETFTDSVVRTLMQRDHVLGVTVAVVQGNTPLLVKGYGYDRLSPTRRVDPNNSLFRIGSVTKTFTWIVARQEIEAGRIKLDAPIGTYLPADIFTEDRRYRPLTLAALMDHTGGYEDTSLGHLFQLSGTRMASIDSYFRRHKPRRVRDPGQFSSYSNFGAALAATALAQTAKAKDVPSLMEARIFQPLGMDHTSLREPYSNDLSQTEDLPAPLTGDLTQDLSDGFIWDGATYEAQPFDYAMPLSGALGASSTAKDMARFMTVMLGNGQVDGIQLYNADSARAFRTPMLKMPEGYNGWASGLVIRQAPAGYTTYGHGGATLWFNSNLVVVPELNLGIFISTNTQTGGNMAESYPNLLLDHLEGDLVRPPLMPTANMAYAAHKDYYQALKGQYVATRRAYGGLEGAITRLVNTVEVSVDQDGRLILTTPNGISAFVPASAQGFFNQQDSEDPGPAQQTGGLHFIFNTQGTQVAAFETQTNLGRYERIGWIHSPDTVGLLTLFMIGTCVVVWISLAKGPARHERPTTEQARASIVSAGLALLWVIAIFTFNSWKSHLADDPSSLFTHWPSGQVQLASWLALVATIGTLYQAGTFYFVYNETGRYSEGWALWQKIAHGLLLAYWLFYIAVLGFWGALEPWSW